MRKEPGPVPLLVLVGLVLLDTLLLLILGFAPSRYLSLDTTKELILLGGTALLLVERAAHRLRVRAPEAVPGGAVQAVLGLLLLLLLLAALRAYEPTLALRRLAVFTAGFALALEARSRIRSAGAMRGLLGTLAGVGAVVATLGILQRLGVDLPGFATERRAVSTLGNPNFAASALVLLIPAAAALVTLRRGRGRILPIVALILMLAHLVVTKGRAGWLGLVVAILAGVATWLALRGRRRVSIGLYAGAGLVLVAAVVGIATADRWAGESVPGLGRTDTVRVRSLVWGGTARLVREAPILGHGLTDFAAEYPRVRPVEEYHLSLHRDVLSPHSDVLELAVEAGIGAGLLLLLAVVLFVREVLRGREPDDPERDVLAASAVAAVLGLLAAGAASFPLSHPGHLATWFVLLGAGLGLRDRSEGGRTVGPVVAGSTRLVYAAFLVFGAVLAYRALRCEMEIQRATRSKEPAAEKVAIREAAAWCPANADAQMLRGRMEARLGRDAPARDAYGRILEGRPHHVGAMNQLGVIAARADDLGEAERWLERALDVNPDYIDALQNLATVRSQQDRMVESADLLRRAIDVALPDRRDRYHPHLVRALFRANRPEEALRELGDFLGRMVEAERAGDAAQAMGWLTGMTPGIAPSLTAFARRLASEDRFDEAEIVLSGIVAGDASAGDAWTELERIARQRKEPVRANGYLVRARLAYAYEAVVAGDLEQAERHIRVAVARQAPETEVLYLYALVLVKRDKLYEAMLELEKAAELGLRGASRLVEEPILDKIRIGAVWERTIARVLQNDAAAR